MPIVRSFGTLQGTAPPHANAPAFAAMRTAGLDAATAYTYADMYRTQPNVRTVIDFLARNIAQIGLHAYRRVSDTDRERIADHDVVRWVGNPNPSTTGYRLMEALMQDLGIYFAAYWLKVRVDPVTIGLARIPPESVKVEGWLLPTGFVWTLPDGAEIKLKPAQVVYFTGYDPSDPLQGLSPLETLRSILDEDAAAHTYRRAYWRNSARIEGVITRPATAPKWTAPQKDSWREQWQHRFAGQHNAGQIPVLEDGMTFTAASNTARDSEYVASRKLTAEEVARAYHVPLPMVGILEHATFSNIREQHKNLYQDCLAPWLEMIQQEIARQLLPESDDTDDIYLEFNIADKLKGSFEEQAQSLITLIGRPILTANEGRARLNLSSIKDDPTADQLALPLNTSGGPAAEDEERKALPPGDAPADDAPDDEPDDEAK